MAIASSGLTLLTLTGGAGGNNTLQGGSGNDTALYSGPRSNYWVTVIAVPLGTNTQAIVSYAGGTDTLVNIEFIQFADARIDLGGAITVASPAPPASPDVARPDGASSISSLGGIIDEVLSSINYVLTSFASNLTLLTGSGNLTGLG